MPLNPGEAARLRNLCKLFSIDVYSTEDNPPAALSVVTCLYSMPAIANHNERRRCGNEILQSAYAHFTPSDGAKASRFFGQVSARVIEIQEFPSWYAEMSRSPEDLVRIYQNMASVVAALKFIGVGAGSGAIAAGLKEALEAEKARDMAKAGIKTTVGRLSGRGAIFEGIEARYGKKMSLQPALFVIIAAATTVYFSLIEEMRKIKIVILDKFQNGKMSKELLAKACSEIDPNSIKKYWEM